VLADAGEAVAEEETLDLTDETVLADAGGGAGAEEETPAPEHWPLTVVRVTGTQVDPTMDWV